MIKKTAHKQKLDKFRKELITPPEVIEYPHFGSDDLLKHYIRKYHWLKRITDWLRDHANDDGSKAVTYFTLCAKAGLDVRMLRKAGHLGIKDSKVCAAEFIEADYNILHSWFNETKALRGSVFKGKLSDIAAGSEQSHFWSAFPMDVINLDFLGDILRHGRQPGVNDFWTIDSVLSKQKFRNRPYELWITVRAKEGRFEPKIKAGFRTLLQSNLDTEPSFQQAFYRSVGKELNAPAGKELSALSDEQLFLFGFVKWLFQAAKRNFSVLVPEKLDILKYERHSEKDDKEYRLYNILCRIDPYSTVDIPLEQGDAADHCKIEYSRGIRSCFKNLLDVNREYSEYVEAHGEEGLKSELHDLYEEFHRMQRGEPELHVDSKDE